MMFVSKGKTHFHTKHNRSVLDYYTQQHMSGFWNWFRCSISDLSAQMAWSSIQEGIEEFATWGPPGAWYWFFWPSLVVFLPSFPHVEGLLLVVVLRALIVSPALLCCFLCEECGSSRHAMLLSQMQDGSSKKA